MTHVSRLRQRAFAASVLSIVYLVSAGMTAGQFKNLFGGGDKGPSYKTFRDPAGRFELDYPTKDWRLLPSGGSSLAVFVSNDGPTLVVDLQRLPEPVLPAEIDGMADVEVSILKDQQPKATDIKATMLDTKGGRGVLIRYSRGPESEVGVLYSIPAGQDLFRINGAVPVKLLPKFEPIIMHMIQSFKAPADPAGAKK